MSGPSRKRAGTLTYAGPDEPAQRVRLSTTRQYHAKLAAQHNSMPSMQTYVQHLSGGMATSNVNEEVQLHQQNSGSRLTSEFQSLEPVEYPFPPMPTPEPNIIEQRQVQPRNKHLSLVIPISDEFCSSDPIAISPHGGNPIHLFLPTPPRSHPSNPALFSESPPSRSYSQIASPLSSQPTSPSVPNSSAWPSFSTAASALSPITPGTPVDEGFYDSAVASLREALKADVFGMSVSQFRDRDSLAESQLEDIKYFATCRQRKRSGRVLVRSAIRMRSSGAEQLKREAQRRRSSIMSKHMDTIIEAQQTRKSSGTNDVLEPSNTPPQLPDIPPTEAWWRDVNWSGFSSSITSQVETSYIEPDSDDMDEDEGIAPDYEMCPEPDVRNERSDFSMPLARGYSASQARCTSNMTCEHAHVAEAMDLTRSIPVKVSTKAQTQICVDCDVGYCNRAHSVDQRYSVEPMRHSR